MALSPALPMPASPPPTSRPFPPTVLLSLMIGLYELLWHLLLPVLLLFYGGAAARSRCTASSGASGSAP